MFPHMVTILLAANSATAAMLLTIIFLKRPLTVMIRHLMTLENAHLAILPIHVT